MTFYVVHSLAWSLAGFILGWVLGQFGREVRQIGREVREIERREIGEPMPEPEPRWKRPQIEHIVGIVVVILAAITMVTAVASAARLQSVTECQSHFNTTYRNALAERTESTAKVRQAQVDMVVELGAPGSDLNSPEVRKYLNIYRDVLRQDDQARLANPLPPTVRCP